MSNQVGTWRAGDTLRRGQSFLYATEQRWAAHLARLMPAWTSPSHLSIIGAIGAAIAAGLLIASHRHAEAIWLLPLAMLVNWFGLSVDLPLARARNAERAGAGMTHHLCELFSHLLLILSFGFSPFLTLRSAAVVFVCYLLFSAYTYLRAATRHIEQMAYIGIGVTEFRILIAFWPFLATMLGVPASLDDPMPAIDIAVISLASFAVAGLFGKWFLDSRKIAAASSAPEERG